jgi:hypothetical protein
VVAFKVGTSFLEDRTIKPRTPASKVLVRAARHLTQQVRPAEQNDVGSKDRSLHLRLGGGGGGGYDSKCRVITLKITRLTF